MSYLPYVMVVSKPFFVTCCKKFFVNEALTRKNKCKKDTQNNKNWLHNIRVCREKIEIKVYVYIYI